MDKMISLLVSTNFHGDSVKNNLVIRTFKWKCGWLFTHDIRQKLIKTQFHECTHAQFTQTCEYYVIHVHFPLLFQFKFTRNKSYLMRSVAGQIHEGVLWHKLHRNISLCSQILNVSQSVWRLCVLVPVVHIQPVDALPAVGGEGQHHRVSSKHHLSLRLQLLGGLILLPAEGTKNHIFCTNPNTKEVKHDCFLIWTWQKNVHIFGIGSLQQSDKRTDSRDGEMR